MDGGINILISDMETAFSRSLSGYLKRSGFRVNCRYMESDEMKHWCRNLDPDVLVISLYRTDEALPAAAAELKELFPHLRILVLSYTAAPPFFHQLVSSGVDEVMLLPAALALIHRRLAQLLRNARPEKCVRQFVGAFLKSSCFQTESREFPYFCAAVSLRLTNPAESESMDWLYAKTAGIFGVPQQRAERILRRYVKDMASRSRRIPFLEISEPGVKELITAAADAFASQHGLYSDPEDEVLSEKNSE